MSIQLKKQSYEKLIRQLIFVEENRAEIISMLLNKKLFLSKTGIQKYLKGYIHAVESILADIVIVDEIQDFSNANTILPFIVIESNFTLADKNNINHYCHLASDIYEETAEIIQNIYTFSETGLELLMKEERSSCIIDLGNGLEEYTINSIRMP
jgi:hypothetical protein